MVTETWSRATGRPWFASQAVRGLQQGPALRACRPLSIRDAELSSLRLVRPSTKGWLGVRTQAISLRARLPRDVPEPNRRAVSGSLLPTIGEAAKSTRAR